VWWVRRSARCAQRSVSYASNPWGCTVTSIERARSDKAVSSGGGRTGGFAGTFERQAHGVGVWHIARQGLGHSAVHRLGAIALQQPRQPQGDRAQVVPACGGTPKQLSHRRHGLRQPVGGAVGSRAALVIEQRLEMFFLLDLCPAVPTAPMAGQHDGTVEHAQALGLGQHRQRAPYMSVGDGVVVEVEANVGRLAGMDLHTLGHRVVVLGQLHQAGLLDHAGLAYRQPVVFRPAPITGGALAPGQGLRVEVVQVGGVAGSEEVVTDVADAAFDPALLVASRHRHHHRARLVAMGGGEGQHVGMEPDGVARALEHGTLEVVVLLCPGALCAQPA